MKAKILKFSNEKRPFFSELVWFILKFLLTFDVFQVQLSLFQPKHRAIKPNDKSREAKLNAVLASRIPGAALENIIAQILEDPVNLTIVRNRTSKTGDFRPPNHEQPARVTINGGLNPFAFLVTLVHELAHHHVYLEHSRVLMKFTLRRKKRPLPHGKEWKEQFRQLMEPYLNEEVFPQDLLPVLKHYLENPRASSSVDHELSKALKKHDPPDLTIRLEELPFDAVFTIHGKRIFRKKEQVRTRFRCLCLKTNRMYLVSRGAPVVPFNS